MCDDDLGLVHIRFRLPGSFVLTRVLARFLFLVKYNLGTGMSSSGSGLTSLSFFLSCWGQVI